jgi:hypothetical protein
MIKTRHLAFTFLVLVGINTVNFYDRQVLWRSRKRSARN